jgi:hypothetical protein
MSRGTPACRRSRYGMTSSLPIMPESAMQATITIEVAADARR